MDTGQISDGYHTFDELYEHRTLLFLSLCRALSHRLNLHKARDPNSEDWFVVYLPLPRGQISYHVEKKYWEILDDVDEVEYGSIFDGHTSEDVLKRLKHFLVEGF